MKRLMSSMLCTIAVLWCCAAVAETLQDEPVPGSEVTEMEEKAGWAAQKFVRGITNILTGWVELFKQPAQRTQQDGLGAGMTTGLAEGLTWTLLRTGAGVWDAVTWPGALIIPDAKPVIEPPTVFEEAIIKECE